MGPKTKSPMMATLAVALALLVAPAAFGAEDGSIGRAGDAAWLPTHPVEPQSSQALDLFEDGVGYAATAAGTDLILDRTTDSGLTWSPAAPLPVSSGFTSFGTSSRGYIAEFGGEGIWVTRDGAETWDEGHSFADAKLDGAFGETRVSGVDALGSTLVAVGGYRAPVLEECRVPSPARTFLGWSRDGGSSWRLFSLPFYGTPHWIDILDARHGVAIVYDRYEADDTDDCLFVSNTNAVYTTKDAGRSWQRVMSCDDGLICSSASMADPKTILVGTNEARMFRSEDRGQTFTEIAKLANPVYTPLESLRAFWIAGIGFASPEVGYASTKGGGTYRTDDGGRTWAMEHSTELVWGLGAGDLAVADEEHAIAGGPNFLITRVEGP